MQKTNKNKDIKNTALCLDLDGTLIRSDALFESIFQMAKVNPFLLLLVPIWLLKGKPNLKEEINKRIDFNAKYLPYNQGLIDYAISEKSSGRKIYLATASHISIAQKVAEHLNFFDGVYATKDGYNLKSNKKAKILNQEFGKGNYVYAGDAKVDFNIWKDSAAAIVVSNKSSFIDDVRDKFNIEKEFYNKSNLFKSILKEIRVYQWVKNILLFLPIVLAHTVDNITDLTNVLIGFFSFSISASFVYVLNDLLDLDSDRNHPRKKNRPLASGDLPIQIGIALVPILFIIGVGLSLLLNFKFQLILLAYILITTAYSFSLKKIPILDIIILATLFTSRIVAGAFAANVYLSMWILAFSMFFFMNLAVLKRYTELLVMKKNKQIKAVGRGYHIEDMGLLLSIGPAAGFLSVLVFVLYIDSSQATGLYSEPLVLWLIAPVFLYWISRIWHLSVRGNMTDDPIVFTGKDKVSYIVGLIIFIIAFLAS
ncbi:MAG: UbiA family prenyltransferase [Candidatus Kapaibacterium sp.]